MKTVIPVLYMVTALLLALTIAGCDSSGGGNGQEDLSTITYAGTFYEGQGDTIDSSSPMTSSYFYPEVKVTSPAVRAFEADAFFVLKGSVNNTGAFQYSIVYVEKKSTGEQTSYWVRGNYQKRIWLRFGAGEYTVTVHRTEITSGNCDDYSGDILGWQYWTATYTFTVYNTRVEDGTFSYPSDPVQSDSMDILEIAQDITAGDTAEYDKILSVHDYVVTSLFYDDDSLVPGERKKQDALTTLENGTGVCEGYTSLYNALLRSLGIPSKCIAGWAGTSPPDPPESINHAWSQVYGDSVWKYVDTTWDDPGPHDAEPYNLFYTFFWQDSLTDHYHVDEIDRPERSILPQENRKWVGYPDGIY